MDLFTYFEEEKQFEALPEEEARNITSQVINALLHSHKSGVSHLDIKLDNIMINPESQQVKVIDFGLCDIATNGEKLVRRCGSEEYCAPELLDSHVTSFSGVKLDVWCLGVVLYCLLAAQFPFNAKNRRTIMAYGGEHPTVSFSSNISGSAQDLLSKMLEINPAKRITMEEVAAHPWIVAQQQSQ